MLRLVLGLYRGPYQGQGSLITAVIRVGARSVTWGQIHEFGVFCR